MFIELTNTYSNIVNPKERNVNLSVNQKRSPDSRRNIRRTYWNSVWKKTKPTACPWNDNGKKNSEKWDSVDI